jgi:uncharacterized membrane protein
MSDALMLWSAVCIAVGMVLKSWLTSHWLFTARTFWLLFCGAICGRSDVPSRYKWVVAVLGGLASGFLLRAIGITP